MNKIVQHPMPAIMTHSDSPATMANWLKSLKNPFGDIDKCPLNFNTIPTLHSFLYRSPGTMQMSVSANTCRQLVFFGRSNVDTTEFAEQAGFQYMMTIGSTNYVVGPCPVVNGATTYAAINGCYSPGLVADPGAVGSANVDLSYGANGPLSPANPNGPTTLDFAFLTASRFRCRPVSIGVRLEQTTPLSSRGGTAISVCPTQGDLWGLFASNAAAKIAGFDIFPSYKDWGTLTKPIDISPAMLPTDLAYTTVKNSQSPWLDRAAVIVWLVNNTSSTQTYNVEYITNWEIAGTAVQQFGNRAVIAQHHEAYAGALPSIVASEHPSPGSVTLSKVADHMTSGVAATVQSIAHVAQAAGKAASAVSPLLQFFH